MYTGHFLVIYEAVRLRWFFFFKKEKQIKLKCENKNAFGRRPTAHFGIEIQTLII